jgi:hypothetical protein
MATTGVNSLTDVVGAAAAVYTLTGKQKQVAVRNLHATQVITCRVFTGNTSAAAIAAATATPAVIGASENITIPAAAAGARTVVLKSGRSVYVSLSMIASGASTGVTVEGTTFKDGQ